MRVFWYSIKNYFRSLRFIFTPIGIISFCLIIGLSIAIPNIINAVKNMVDTVAATYSGYSVDWNEAGGYFLNFAMEQDWKDFNTTIAKFMDPNYLIESFKHILCQIFPTLEADTQAVAELVSNAISTIILNIVIVLVFLAVGFILAFIITRMFVRQDITKRRIWQRFVFSLLDVAVSVLVIWGCIKVLDLGGWGIALAIVILLAHSVFAVFEGWLIHGVKRIKLKEALNFKNVILLLLSNLLIIALGVGTLLLVNLTKMMVLTVVIGLSLFIITNAVITANSEGFIGFLANDVKNAKDLKEYKKLKNN